jgi:hypothetical protein
MNDGFVHSFSKIIKSAKGECRLRIQVLDLDENMKLEMTSPKHKVKCSTVVHELARLGGVGYKVTI